MFSLGRSGQIIEEEGAGSLHVKGIDPGFSLEDLNL